MTKVYISSTYADLKEHREAVYRLLAKVPGREIHAMEDYVASDERPLEACLKDVAACDVYVGIFAWRYGFVPVQDNPAGASITELEYRRARAAGKKSLIFLLDREAPWVPAYMDSQSGEAEAGRKINTLKKSLEQDHVVSYFKSADQLAGLVSAAVTRLEKELAPQPVAPAAPAPAVVQVRELRNSLLLAFSPSDEGLAKQIAEVVQTWVDKPVLLSKSALFAQDEAGFVALEDSVARCCAALPLLTPTCLDQLKQQSGHVAKALALMRARTGAVGAVLAGAEPSALPPAWGLEAVCRLAAAGGGNAAYAPLREWSDRVMPPWGTRLVGLPVSVFAMTQTEVAALDADPSVIGNLLGKAVQDQFLKIREELANAGVEWTKRYAERREAWQPFGPGAAAAESIVGGMAADLNQRGPAKLRHRRIRAQWYPFEAVVEQQNGQDVTLRRVYQDVARAGCVLLIDELSLFQPLLRDALVNSPFFNNDQVAIVTLSPFDPARSAVNQVLECEARKRLAGAFTRFASDFDPQCELAVGEERRLKRWLHTSLPETVVSLREPRPDPGAIRAFFEGELGQDARRPGGEYPWAGGGQV